MSDRKELSLRLNDVLEMVGVTDKIRRYHRRRAIVHDILEMVRITRYAGKRGAHCVYLCGSSWEGSVTPDLASDVDIIICHPEPLVTPHRLMAGPDLFLHAVRDEWTRPGYAKLQYMIDGRPLTVYHMDGSETVGFDGEGRACRKHTRNGTMHGPAAMRIDPYGHHLTDEVMAFQSKGIPLFATEWITRQRQYDWPSKHLIDELKLMGCLFVGVGHFESRDEELEWRVSFSKQERIMMKNLNITQHRVYVILKMIRKDVLETHLKEESLSSYHCKTCVFYMIETTPSSLWVPENIINCLMKCLMQLLRWIQNKFCPSFFLKDSNLFDKRGFMRLIDPLERLIASLLQTGHEFLYLLRCDHVGEMLRGGELKLYKPIADSKIDEYIFIKLVRDSINQNIFVFRSTYKTYNPEQDLLLLYMTELEEFQNHENILGCTEAEFRAAIQYALPWLHLSIGLEYAARAVTCPDRHESKELVKTADYHFQQAKNTDRANVRLAQATLLLRLEKLEECFSLLQELERGWTYPVCTLCPCTKKSLVAHVKEQKGCDLATKCINKSLRKLTRERCTSCVIFERSQVELLPSPLRYEMYRSLYTRPGSRDDKEDVWFDRVVVDSKVYLYLLQYLVCSKLNRVSHACRAICNLGSVTLLDPTLDHRETAFNLLGWVYLQIHNVADAERCFLQSWKIRPNHNAVKFHMLDMCLRLKEARARKDT